MDKELIAMCDCPEIQGRDDIAKPATQSDIETLDGRWIQKRGEWLFLPSVSWLLRKIEVGDIKLSLFHRWELWSARLTHPCERELSARNIYTSPPSDSPEKALLHVFLWQLGKVWKDGRWMER